MSHLIPLFLLSLLPVQASLEPIAPFREGLSALVFPDISNLEETVKKQITSLHGELTELIEAKPTNVNAIRDAYLKMGRTFHAYKRYDLAHACYHNGDVLSPGRFETVYLIADLARIQGHKEDAERLYRKCLELLPTYNATYIRLGNIVLQQNRLEEAGALFQKAFDRDSLATAAIFGLARVADLKGEFDKAIELYTACLEQVGEANRVHYLLGMVWRKKGDVEKAKLHLGQAGKIGIKVRDQIANNLERFVESGRVHLIRGKTAFGAGDFLGAAREFQQAVAALPDEPGVRVNLALALAKLGQGDQAREHLRIVIEADPANQNAHFNLGTLALQANNRDDAIRHLGEAVRLDPKDVQARYYLAGQLKAKGDLEQAYRHFDIVAELEPNNENALVQRAGLLLGANRFKQAAEVLEKDWQHNQSSGRLTHLYARLLAICPDQSLRNGPLALDLAQRIVNVSQTAEHLETYAMALAQTGKCDEAAQAQKKALDAAKAEQRPDLVSRMEADLARYQQGAPCEPK